MQQPSLFVASAMEKGTETNISSANTNLAIERVNHNRHSWVI
jgi:hypothetical protein